MKNKYVLDHFVGEKSILTILSYIPNFQHFLNHHCCQCASEPLIPFCWRKQVVYIIRGFFRRSHPPLSLFSVF